MTRRSKHPGDIVFFTVTVALTGGVVTGHPVGAIAGCIVGAVIGWVREYGR